MTTRWRHPPEMPFDERWTVCPARGLSAARVAVVATTIVALVAVLGSAEPTRRLAITIGVLGALLGLAAIRCCTQAWAVTDDRIATRGWLGWRTLELESIQRAQLDENDPFTDTIVLSGPRLRTISVPLERAARSHEFIDRLERAVASVDEADRRVALDAIERQRRRLVAAAP